METSLATRDPLRQITQWAGGAARARQIQNAEGELMRIRGVCRLHSATAADNHWTQTTSARRRARTRHTAIRWAQWHSNWLLRVAKHDDKETLNTRLGPAEPECYEEKWTPDYAAPIEAWEETTLDDHGQDTAELAGQTSVGWDEYNWTPSLGHVPWAEYAAIQPMQTMKAKPHLSRARGLATVVYAPPPGKRYWPGVHSWAHMTEREAKANPAAKEDPMISSTPEGSTIQTARPESTRHGEDSQCGDPGSALPTRPPDPLEVGQVSKSTACVTDGSCWSHGKYRQQAHPPTCSDTPWTTLQLLTTTSLHEHLPCSATCRCRRTRRNTDTAASTQPEDPPQPRRCR